MSEPLRFNKITEAHLARRAVVYVRQSSAQQVRHHQESQRRQYALAERAKALGWSEVTTIAGDLGRSAGLGAAERAGFEQIIASVALGEVGIVLCLEASRLSRTDKDWCRLMEVCQLFRTLVADEQQIYDLDLLDDQLVLGIKGTLSVVELKILKQRMLEGQRSAAQRGVFRMHLPCGYVHDADGQLVKDPDVRVQEVVALVFRKYCDVGTIRGTCLWFVDAGIELPMRQVVAGRTRIVWRVPNLSLISSMLRNPTYAGAYVYGRRPHETVMVDKHLIRRRAQPKAPEASRVFLRDHHEAYIAWETYEENQRRLQRNASRPAAGEESVGSARKGESLLAGLLRCAHCGRKLHVRYPQGKGSVTYLCHTPEVGVPGCISFSGARVDEAVGAEVLRAISPFGVEASLRALEDADRSVEDRLEPLRRQIEQLSWEAQRAFEQYDAVDARYRLVAGELERRWNAKLEECERQKAMLAEVEREVARIGPAERTRIQFLGEHFAGVWRHPHCSFEIKKQIARLVLETVVVRREVDRLELVLHWKGGVHTALTVARPRAGRPKATPPEALDVIRRLAPRYGDGQIAAVLNRLEIRTGQGHTWNESRVASVRRTNGIAGHTRAPVLEGILNLKQATQYCSVSNRTIEKLVEGGYVRNEQTVPLAPWEIPRADLDSPPVRRLLEQVRRTGRLVLEGGVAGLAEEQLDFFAEDDGGENGRH